MNRLSAVGRAIVTNQQGETVPASGQDARVPPHGAPARVAADGEDSQWAVIERHLVRRTGLRMWRHPPPIRQGLREREVSTEGCGRGRDTPPWWWRLALGVCAQRKG